jgi:hypothetical protein
MAPISTVLSADSNKLAKDVSNATGEGGKPRLAAGPYQADPPLLAARPVSQPKLGRSRAFAAM